MCSYWRTIFLLYVICDEAMIYGTYFYNMDLTHWFSTRDEAEEYGRKSGFQWTLVERTMVK